MESSFTTALFQRGEPLSLLVHTLQRTAASLHSLSISFSCSSCTSRFSCNWCPVEFQCRTSGVDCSQSPVVSVRMLHWYSAMYIFALWSTARLFHLHSSSSPPPPFMIIHPNTFFQSTSSSCPRLLPALTGDGRYYLHEGLGPQDESLVLRGENLLIAVSNHCYYETVFSKLCMYIVEISLFLNFYRLQGSLIAVSSPALAVS